MSSPTVWKSKFNARWTILGIIILFLTMSLTLMGFLDSVARKDIDTAMVMLVPVLMLTMGFPSGNAVNGGFKVDPKFSADKSVKVLFYMAISTAAILMINVTKNVSSSMGLISDNLALPGLAIVNISMFAVIMAVSEETFFRYFLTKLFSNLTTNKISIIIVGLMMFPAYHFWRYGPYLPLLIVTALCGVVLSWVYIQSEMPSAVILPHALINYMGFISAPQLIIITAMTFGILFVFRNRRLKKN